MIRHKISYTTFVTTVLALSVAALVHAQTPGMTRMKEELHKDTAVTDAELKSMEPELKRYLQQKRNRVQVRELVRSCIQNECRGECLSESLKAMNRAIERGVSEKEARDIVTQAVREEANMRRLSRNEVNDAQFGERIRERVDVRLSEREQKMDRIKRTTPMKKEDRPGGHGTGGRGR